MTRLLLLLRAIAAATVVGGTLAGGSLAAASATSGSSTSAAPPTSAALDCDIAAATTVTATTAASAGSDTAPASTAPVTTSPPVAPSSLQIPLPNATAPPASTAAAAPSSAPPLDEVLVLRRDGLDVATFCEDAETVIATVTALAGPSDDDTGWADPFSISACGGTVARRVTWGSLDLYFGDESRFGSGAPHFFGYSYGNIDGFDAAPSGLATPEGVGLGTPVAYLRATYPDVTIFPGEEGIQEPAFYVDENLGGLLTSDTDDGVITLIIGGEACGV